MHLIIKLPNTNLDIDIDYESSVEQLRSLCAQKLNSVPEDVCLVYKGKIMRDKDFLKNLDVVDGSNIHCALKKSSNVQKTEKSEQKIEKIEPDLKNSPQAQAQTTAPLNFPVQNFSNLNINNMAQNLDLNELSRYISESNLLENITNMSPQHRKFFETYPELMQALKDPAVVKQIMEAFKNPAVMKDLLANQDAMLNQLQNVPGGLNQYMQFMKEMNSLNEPPEKVPTSSGPVNVDGSTVNVHGDEMPNPWKPNTEDRNKFVIQDDSPLLRDTIRALKLMDTPETQLSQNFVNSIQAAIKKLGPRGIYGLTEMVKGLEVVKEESPELVILMLNYQVTSLRIAEAHAQNVAPENAAIPPENATEDSYREQLSELGNMGFNNKEENIEALRHSYGDVAAAVDWILRRRGIL